MCPLIISTLIISTFLIISTPFWASRKCAYNDWTQYLESEISEYLILHA